MSHSPSIRRLSTEASSREELINAYEAEEERIINVLSRKLEQLRQEKIGLENVLEAESESHVNQLSRELSALRIAQQQLQQHHSPGANGASASSAESTGNGVFSLSPETRFGVQLLTRRENPHELSPEVMLDAMRRENEQLRSRLTETEREFIRISRLNDIYREELIEHRRRIGVSVDDLIGMPPSDPLSQPTHRRPSVSFSNGSSPSTSIYHVSTLSRPPHSNGVPIPRPPSQLHRPSDLTTPLSQSPGSSSDAPFPFSPPTSRSSGNPASYVSTATNVTSPLSPASFNHQQQMAVAVPLGRGLSYPSVPPPSLSSSFGSPNIPYHMPVRDPSSSPIEPLSRRNSNARRGSIDRSRGASRRASLDFGARVAETGTLVPRNRGGESEGGGAGNGRSQR
ncbi:hypothetical protein DFP72DRAFT_1044093 [Ephemerocybe angulata]|uniref:Uncharacterized protein n=1 Tax=Ephemerocybe angulata TaxID=980116 RepID=A0A8H6I2R4_9AGAR|nr:hypothetical protein DFP72DRAFT_1044093 [Tulosesus angulatus]